MKRDVLYSDGTIEDNIIQYLTVHKGDPSHIISELPEGSVFHNFSAARKNLISWYPFTKKDSVLEIGAGMGSLTEELAQKCREVVAIEPSPKRAQIISLRCQAYKNVRVITQGLNQYEDETKYDYVLLIGVLEYAGITMSCDDPWLQMLTLAKRHLKETGKILVAIENKFGLKYWCGAAEDHTGIPFDSINNYQKSEGETAHYQQSAGVRTFSQAELTHLFHAAGLHAQKYYYPLPDYKFPMLILSDQSKDTGLIGDVKFNYPEESLLVADQKAIYPEVMDNHCFGFFANSFFAEVGVDESKREDDIETVMIKRDYLPRYRITTILKSDRVIRKACTEEGEEHLRELVQNTNLLIERGIPCVAQSEIFDGMTQAQRIAAPRADYVFEKALKNRDSQLVFRMLEKLRGYLLKSSALIEKNGQAVLEDAFPDLTFRNSFWVDDDLLFFDQEWRTSDMPLDFALYRTVRYAAKTHNALYQAVLQYCNLTEEKLVQFEKDEQNFLDSLMDQESCFWFDKTAYQERLTYENKVKAQIRNKEAHIELLLESERKQNTEINLQSKMISNLTAENAEQRDRIAAVSGQVEEKERCIAELTAQNTEQENCIAEMKRSLCNQQGHIELLLESDRELERIKNSRSWRFMGYAWKLRDAFIPKGSKRRLFGKMIVKFVKHPIRFLSKCTPHKISKFFKVLRREGVEGTSHRLDDCLIGNQIPKQKLRVETLPAENAAVKTAADYESLHIPNWAEPCVSIVIPVYNQFDYTYACVKSILQNSGDMTYEIIIADDCSTDVTTEIDQIITGLKTIHNQENLRFLRNCNNAAKYARGKYILFLNNDTQVQENWLAPLVELMERDRTIGMTGSKLVYPDGRLQEAGGIFWEDASAWNYGNRSDATAPEYNYVKDADYISGAAICIRKTLWEEIGGFDERFVPAYCEDSDLAFETRKHGYRVVYQPASVVVHFEGVSNGTDTSSGQKAYQVINQKKFFEKWKDTLEREHFPNGENVFQARDRSRYKKTVLVVDHYVPQYDKDAGSRTVFAYLKLFAENGYSVKFIGDNFYPHQPYTQALQQLGIEVLYGPYYANHWMDWLKENGSCIQYVLLNRPHISVKYIDAVRELTPARIMYYGHDLHFLRERREYELTGDPDTLRSSEKWKKNELALMRKADMSYYPSCVEEEAIHAIDPAIRVKAIPAYLFSDVEDVPYSMDGRRDLMFIGGFGHHPNVDAVKWLAAEIMPRLEELLPEAVIHILGSNPPEEVKKLASEKLRIEGFVTDAELEDYYRASRLVIVPLRYGAGIKGKVVEAMRYGMPVVTTSIGAEGIIGAEKFLAIADDPRQFAEMIAALYNDEASLKQRSAASYRYVRENYSSENAKKAIGPEFDMR